MIQFESYTPLIVTVLVCTLGIVAYLVGFRDKLSFSQVRSLFFRFSALVLLAATLSGPERRSSSKSGNLPVLLDISESLDPAVGEELLNQARRTAERSGLDLVVVPFAKKAAPFPVKVTASDTYASLKRLWERLNIGETSLASPFNSIEGGSNNLGQRTPVLLITDGWDTAGEALSLPADVAAKGIRVYPLLPSDPTKATREFKLINLFAPLTAPSNKSVDVRINIRNSSETPQTGTLVLMHDGKSIFQERITVPAGKEVLVTAPSDPSPEGIKELTATLTPESGFRPSTQTIFLSGEERSRILLVSGSADDARFLREVLVADSYRLTAVIGGSAEAALSELSKFEAIIFNNVHLNQLPIGVVSKIAAYTRGGGGFLMIGGNKSFGLGGYLRTPIEDILPVSMLPPQTVEKRLNVAVSLVLDKSGSMAQGSKLDYAKEAAREVIRNLKDDDYVGVIGFDAAPWIVVKMGQLGEIRENALERVGRLFPAQKTNLIPAIDEARRSLERAQAGRKHMIILTDGEVPDGGPFYIELTKQLRLLGITVSTVMLAGDADISLLKKMAEVGGGSFYQTLDASSLPRIFLTDIKTTSGERTMKEQQDYAVRPGPNDIVSTTLRSFPSVRGYVGTKPKSNAQLELVVSAEGKSEPLLASWVIGNGKSAAFTSDLSGRWSRNWIEWSRLSQFTAELLDSIRPSGKGESEPIRFDLKPYVEGGYLNLDLAVYTEGVTGEIRAVVVTPNREEKEVIFEQLSRGRFLGKLADATAGKYEVRMSTGSRRFTPVAFALPGNLFGEKKDQGFNLPLLSSFAGQTGGVLNPEDEVLAIPEGSKREPLSHFFLLGAALLLLLEILFRELWRARRSLRRTA